jgi:hypothetical protein
MFKIRKTKPILSKNTEGGKILLQNKKRLSQKLLIIELLGYFNCVSGFKLTTYAFNNSIT